MLFLYKSTFKHHEKTSILNWCYHQVELKRKSIQRMVFYDYYVQSAVKQTCAFSPLQDRSQTDHEDCVTDTLHVRCMSLLKLITSICMVIGLMTDDVTSNIIKVTKEQC